MSKKNAFRKRFDFSKIPATIQIPNLIEVQKRSYERFLQMDQLPSEREDAGLQAVFQSVFPITDFRNVSQLEFVDYSIGNWECKCGHLKGLHHLRTTCKNCGATVITDPFHPGDVLCHKCGTYNTNTSRLLQQVRRPGRPAAEVRRGRVRRARHDLFRSAEGHHAPDRSTTRTRRPATSPSATSKNRKSSSASSADDRERHVHHQRHRARHRQPVAPLARRVLRDAPTTAPTSSARSFLTADRGWSSNTTRRTCSTSASTASASSSARFSCAPSACDPAKTFCATFYTVDRLAIRDKKLFWTLDPASEKPTNLLGMKLAHSIKTKRARRSRTPAARSTRHV